jgi:putative two-component system response regulator
VATTGIADLRAVVTRVKQASHPDVKLALVRIAGESKEKFEASSPESSEFFDSLRHSLAQLKGRANAELRIGCYFDCARYYYIAGDALKGAEAARHGLALANAVNNDALASRGYSHLGNVLADAGAIADAIEAYVNGLVACKRSGDLDWRAVTFVNLGVALFYAAQYHDAIACFDFAEELSESAPKIRERVRLGSLSNKALCFLYMNRLQQGLAAAEQCLHESPAPVTGQDLLARIIRECNYAQLLLESGQVEAAAARLPTITAFALRANSQKAFVMSKVVEGLIEIQRGDASRGIQLLLDARDLAGEVNSLSQDALIGLVKGYELLGQSKRALDHMQQLMKRVCANRKECALLHLNASLGVPLVESLDSENDLIALTHREALLRAKVAEEQLAWSQIEMLERLAVTADLREEDTGEHGYRVGRLSALLAEDLGMDADTCLAVDLAARLHDIGKMGIPDRILLTSKELKEAERHFMCQHTIIGAELLAKSNIPQLRLAEAIALYHHEWWDGSGYPKELAGKRIPVHARIVALADMFDALTHGRPYAQLWEMDRALAEIVKRRGTQFDPELTDRFVNLVARLRKAHPNLDEFLARAGQNSPFLQARRKIKVMLEEERAHERRNALPGNATRH